MIGLQQFQDRGAKPFRLTDRPQRRWISHWRQLALGLGSLGLCWGLGGAMAMAWAQAEGTWATASAKLTVPATPVLAPSEATPMATPATQTKQAASTSPSAPQTPAQRYTTAMLIGYAAAEQGDYHTALINFRRALAVRPGDRYATAAIRNMETYIARQRAEAAKRAEIARLEVTVAEAVAASDWACAAASVERLVELVPPNSPDRSRLIAYRGELAGMIASRANLESWSTVCPGGQV
ncbi:hypothetical protein GFS31_25040 [Leptolyngbya sp. BL0902]|uniref:hypothetical protein n=1 Tax=Leptolyngbya sp. BL0902 TaxID=1115757 RepID=UPI0018E8CD0E|nr:hypothetical protein [Leptolyngbya sp. BL0902]QQE65814.1 hypothetical protein GFS31_25040 [Leptolyngbya sp. BL0902]